MQRVEAFGGGLGNRHSFPKSSGLSTYKRPTIPDGAGRQGTLPSRAKTS